MRGFGRLIRYLGRDMTVERLSMDRKSSIEDEPLTLCVDKLRFAREAALHVINTMSVEDALRIFTEGLEPVVGARRRDAKGLCVNPVDSEAEEDGRMELVGLRDIVSSPF